MPGYDGTGPLGQGPRTGGGFGFCPPGSGPAYGAGWYGRGAGRGGLPWGGGRGRVWGGGRGWGWRMMSGGYPSSYWGAPPFAQWTPQQELEALQAQAQAMEGDLENIRQRIAQLESEAQKDKKQKK
jgi:hypothetical protein